MTNPEISSFYDSMLRGLMLDYRVHGNLRLEKAWERIRPEVERNSKVLDIGCSIGIITERIGRIAHKGMVWGVDISPASIGYARRTVPGRNIRFMELDVTSGLDRLKDFVEPPLDLITMVDVIEHVPEGDRPRLLEGLRSLCSNKATVVLTFPSPVYQRHLRVAMPETLQPVDEIVEPSVLLAEAWNAGFGLECCAMVPVWSGNQYVHCVLRADRDLEPITEGSDFSWRRLAGRLHAAVDRRIFLPSRRRKYVTRVFGHGPHQEFPTGIKPGP